MRKILLLFIFIFTLSFSSKAQISDSQAMFIYNFCRMIEWPMASKSGDFVIGVYGRSALESSLIKFMNNKNIAGQPIKVVRYGGLEDFNACHVLFVTFGKSSEMVDIAAKVTNYPCLIIGEKDGIIEEGAAINFVIQDDKLRFQLKLANAQKYNLKVSQGLVKMAVM